MRQANQLSRYGAISRMLPMTTGRQFFLVSATETAFSQFSNTFPQDDDGYVRVYTTWAALISQVQLETPAPVIFVSPLFQTAPSLVQLAQLDAAQAVVLQAGQNLPDGSYLASKAAVTTPNSSTTQYLFQTLGKVELISLIGDVMTAIQATALAFKFQFVPDVLQSQITDLCASSDLNAIQSGAILTITGSTAAALVIASQNGVVAKQSTPLILTKGRIGCYAINTTSTGNIKYRVVYKPIDQGAFIYSL